MLIKNCFVLFQNQKRIMKINQDANLPSLGNAVKTLEKSIEILHDLKADVEVCIN